MSKNWIGVASKNHVNIGRKGGFMQVNHGKLAPLKRIFPKDWIIYYSPTLTLGGKDKVQAFTAIGMIKDGKPYQAKMSETFHPYRRDVIWHEAQDVPIHPLLQKLDFTRNNKNWGYQLRFGLFGLANDVITYANC